MENTEQLLKIIEQLKKENTVLKEKNGQLENKLTKTQAKLDKTEVLLYETNKKLNEALLTISSLQEKEKIERTRIFIPKGERLNDIVINETEEIIKEEKRFVRQTKVKNITKRNLIMKNM